MYSYANWAFRFGKPCLGSDPRWTRQKNQTNNDILFAEIFQDVSSVWKGHAPLLTPFTKTPLLL